MTKKRTKLKDGRKVETPNLNEKIRVIVDSRDSTKDKFVSRNELQYLVVRGDVIWDITNESWAYRSS